MERSHIGEQECMKMTIEDTDDDLEPLFISSLAMSIMLAETQYENDFEGMMDAGANVSMGPMRVAIVLRAVIRPHMDTR